MLDPSEPAITPEQIREALRLLGWSVVRFAVRLKISDTTINKFLNGGVYKTAFNPAEARFCLEAAGVAFTADSSNRTHLSLREATCGPGDDASQIRERLSPVERAFALARSGRVKSITEIGDILQHEGFFRGDIEGRYIRRPLRAAMKVAWLDRRYSAPEDLTGEQRRVEARHERMSANLGQAKARRR